MKQTISYLIFTIILCVSQIASAQSDWQLSGTNIYYNQGKVGINTTTPDKDLEVNGDGSFSGDLTVKHFQNKFIGTYNGSNDYLILLFELNNNNTNFVSGTIVGRRGTGHLNAHEVDLFVNHGSVNNMKGSVNYRAINSRVTTSLISCDYNSKKYLAIRFTGTSNHRNGIYFSGQIRSSDPDNLFKIFDGADSAISNITDVDNTDTEEVKNAAKFILNGKVGIGTDSPQSELAVEGEIRSGKVRVMADIAGADFVFEPDYPLRPLSEVEQFVRTHKHLPEIAPAREMQANGVDLTQMNMQLLQKVEELTLYLIGLEKRVSDQAQEISLLKETLEDCASAGNQEKN